MLFFFFFQAEDGIRDKLVTGVQTCALPISAVRTRLIFHITRQAVRYSSGKQPCSGESFPDNRAELVAGQFPPDTGTPSRAESPAARIPIAYVDGSPTTKSTLAAAATITDPRHNSCQRSAAPPNRNSAVLFSSSFSQAPARRSSQGSVDHSRGASQSRERMCSPTLAPTRCNRKFCHAVCGRAGLSSSSSSSNSSI